MFERCYTVACPNGQGPLAETQELYLPDTKNPKSFSAWSSGGSRFNAHIFKGALSQAEAIQRLEAGFVDCLLTVPAAGVAFRTLPDDCSEVTVLFEVTNASNEFQAVTFRVHD